VTPAAEPVEALARIQEASFVRASAATRRAYPEKDRMDGGALFEFLARGRVGVLATVRPDGRPQAGPIGYGLVGSRLVFASLEDAARVRNLRHHPHVSLVVSEEERDARTVVIIDGTARLVRAREAALELRAPFRDEDGELPSWAEVLIVLTPARILSYSTAG
jgi:PPOX class probable F420-dependent enzyme